MTKLQEKLLALKTLREQNAALFAKHEDLGAMPAEELSIVKSNNTQIETLDAECKSLQELEELKSKNADGLTEFKHHAGDAPKPSADGDVLVKRNRELARVKGLPRVAPVRNFKGSDADLRAYQFGQWFMGTVLDADPRFKSGLTAKAARYCQDWGFDVKAMSETVNTAGGALVPQEFANDIIDLREQYGVLRRVIKVTPMASDTKIVPRRTSGLTVYYPGEGSAITASDKGWDQVSLTARKYATLALYSSELNEDAVIDMGNDLAGEIAYAFALAEDQNGFNGDGTSTYARTTGLLTKLKDVWTASGGAGLFVGTGNAYSELTLTDFEAVVGLLPIYARTGAAWICSSKFFHTVMHKLQLAAGGNTAGNIANGGTYQFLGFPVIESQVFPTSEANSQVCCTLGNYMLGGLLGDRRSITLATSTEYKFAEDQIAIKGTERIDINWHSVGDGTTAGPIVGLITAAS